MDKSAEEQLHKAMMNTYHLNLLFLSEFDNNLFIRVNNLSNLIASGDYKERYFIEFIKEVGEFDLYDSHKEKFIYKRNPKKFINQAVVQTNYDLKNSISSLNAEFYNYENEGDFEIDENDSKIFQTSTKKFLNDFHPIKKELNCRIDREHKKINSIDKFMFIGTLLGRHIPKITTKIDAKTFFVCESNLEIFRLSLFLCDYSFMAVEGRSVVFSIMDDDKVFMKKFLDFFNIDLYNNGLIKFYSTNVNVEKYFDRFVDRVLTLNPLSFNYYMNMNNVNNVSKNFFKYKTLTLKDKLKLNGFDNKPVLYLGAGPSLSDEIKWVKKNQSSFIIVTMAATLDILHENDIIPDIVTTVDPQIIVKDQFFKNLKSKEYLKDSIILASFNTHEKVLEELSDYELYLYEVLGSVQDNQTPLGGNSVGEVTYSILSKIINIKQMYLLGIDLALNQETGASHVDTYNYADRKSTRLNSSH